MRNILKLTFCLYAPQLIDLMDDFDMKQKEYIFMMKLKIKQYLAQ